ncbi:hypothetical protein NL676_035419 [Syzygium grande]|nr:hypothetical protein NL676_035419 [Syzygium grande]
MADVAGEKSREEGTPLSRTIKEGGEAQIWRCLHDARIKHLGSFGVSRPCQKFIAPFKAASTACCYAPDQPLSLSLKLPCLGSSAPMIPGELIAASDGDAGQVEAQGIPPWSQARGREKEPFLVGPGSWVMAG